jgi:hypothetical protein
MGNYSRDSFQDTRNALGELLGLAPAGAPGVRNYVSVRLQQAVPVLDADWNEEGDIRRRELELLLARAIGNGVPAGSDGFAISANGLPNNFSIQAGILFNSGWLVYNRSSVNYDSQPYQTASGAAPPLPVPLQSPAQATTFLVYLDAWEAEVSSQNDGNLLDIRIGVETCVRLERAWLARVAPLAANANPLDPSNIPTPQPGHRYYPLATLNRLASPQISAGMINDLRRTNLSLDALTHAPLQIFDPVRDQHLDATRLALAFQGNLDALAGILKLTPEVFVYAGHPVETAQALTALQDVRASATSFQQQSQAGSLYRQTALAGMQTFFTLQILLFNTIKQFATAGLATGFTATFLLVYDSNLNGTSANDPNSMKFALQAGDLLGAVMAQERLNQALGQQSDTLPEGTVALSLISVTPTTPVVANTVYQLTIRVQSFLTSGAGSEPIQVIASAGPGWTIAFEGTAQPNVLVTVTNGQTQDVVMTLTAAPGTANTTLNLTARPQRRQQLVYQNPPVPLALGQPVLPGAAPIVTLTYQGPTLLPGNQANVARSVMFGGVDIPFGVASLSANTETYQLTVVAQGAATGWQAPAQPVLAPLGPGQSRNVSVAFKTTDQAGAASPATYQVQLVRVTGGSHDPQVNTTFVLTFQLTAG